MLIAAATVKSARALQTILQPRFVKLAVNKDSFSLKKNKRKNIQGV